MASRACYSELRSRAWSSCCRDCFHFIEAKAESCSKPFGVNSEAAWFAALERWGSLSYSERARRFGSTSGFQACVIASCREGDHRWWFLSSGAGLMMEQWSRFTAKSYCCLSYFETSSLLLSVSSDRYLKLELDLKIKAVFIHSDLDFDWTQNCSWFCWSFEECRSENWLRCWLPECRRTINEPYCLNWLSWRGGRGCAWQTASTTAIDFG